MIVRIKKFSYNYLGTLFPIGEVVDLPDDKANWLISIGCADIIKDTVGNTETDIDIKPNDEYENPFTTETDISAD